VALSDAASSATIHYTTDKSTPTASSPTYSKPITVSASTTVKAIAVAAGFLTSPLSSGAYVIETQVAMPTFSPQPRGYWTAQSVTLQDATSGAAIYYTMDGTTPTVNSTKYLGKPIPVSRTTTIKAIAVANGDLSSVVSTGLFTIDDPALVEQRVMAQEGIGVELAMQTFLSQVSLAFNVLGPEIGMGRNTDGKECRPADFTFLFSLSDSQHLGGMREWSPTSPTSPGYATVYYDDGCTQPWMNAELDDWTAAGTLADLDAATSETAAMIGKNGSPLGTMNITEAAGLSFDLEKMEWSAMAYGLGTFAPKNSAPTAQLGLTCSTDLAAFLLEGEPASCNGAIAQDFPNLDLSLGFVVPLSFTPVVTPGVTWAGSQFVAVSSAGAILTSPTGSTWTPQASGTGKNLRAVVSSENLLVAVGAAGTILTSANGGTTWTPQSSGTNASLSSVVWSGAQFVAVGWAGTTLTAANGTTWTPRVSGTKELLLGLIWSGSQFVATGGAGVILTSPDGITWTPQSSGTTDSLQAVAWSGTQYLVLDQGGWILTSTDGKNWQTTAYEIPESLNGVVWSPRKKLFVVVGGDGTILTSPDATASTWATPSSGTAFDLKSVAWSGNKFVAIGSGDTVVTAPDGVTWTVQPSVPGTGQLVRFSSGASSAVSGAVGALQVYAPTIQTLTISGGEPYGGATFTGHYGDLAIFPPTPTGWAATDSAHDQQFQVTLGNNTTRILTGSVTSTTTGKTLATFSVDESGTGSITYSDGSKAAVTDWLPAD